MLTYVWSAESANGPTTTCELVTYEAEPQFDLPIDIHNLYVCTIWKVYSV